MDPPVPQENPQEINLNIDVERDLLESGIAYLVYGKNGKVIDICSGMTGVIVNRKA